MLDYWPGHKMFRYNEAEVAHELVPGNPMVMYIHGAGGNHTSMRPVGRCLESHGCGSLYFDTPGGGLSSRERQYSLEEHTECASALARHLQEEYFIDHYVVVGHSKGGAIGQSLAANFPEMFKGLVIISSSHNFEETFADSPIKRVMYDAPKVPSALLKAYNAFWSLMPWNRRKKYPDYSEYRGLDDLGVYLKAHREREYHDIDDAHKALIGVRLWKTEGIAPRIKCPTLILVGDSDFQVSALAAERLNRLIPGSMKEIVKGGQHNMPFQQPELIGGRIEDFIRSLFE